MEIIGDLPREMVSDRFSDGIPLSAGIKNGPEIAVKLVVFYPLGFLLFNVFGSKI